MRIDLFDDLVNLPPASGKFIGTKIDDVPPDLWVFAGRFDIGWQLVTKTPLELLPDFLRVAKRFRAGMEGLILIAEHVVRTRDTLDFGERGDDFFPDGRGVLR